MASLPTQQPPARSDLPVSDELLRRICESPGWDRPREEYANWLEGQGFRDTAELIRLQIARFADDIRRRRYRSRPGPREQQLLERAAYVGEIADYVVPRHSVSVDRGYELHRGFVEFIRVTAQTFVDHTARIFALAPIRHLEILPVPGVALDQILMFEDKLRRLDTLSLPRWELGDDGAEEIAFHLFDWDLVGLELVGNRIRLPGVLALASRSPFELIAVDLTGNPCDPRDVPDYDDNREVRFEPAEFGLEEDRPIRWLHPGELHNADRYHLRLLASQESRSVVAGPPAVLEATAGRAIGTIAAILRREQS